MDCSKQANSRLGSTVDPADNSGSDVRAYEDKVQQQIDQYVNEPIHDLPDIFHVWSHYFLGPGFVEIFGVQTINDFYVGAAREASADFTKECRILSIGCGDGTVEIELASSLRAAGVKNFSLEGADLSPVLIERFEQSVIERGLQDCVFPRVRDLNAAGSGEPYDLVMANHSLHHIVDLETLFTFVHDHLTDKGIFATCDMIGRNGHMRWPEAAVVLQAIWPILSDKQRFHHQLRQNHCERFEDYDCSDVGFEGVRAQDILYLMLNRFNPYKFFAYGGFIDPLIDRGYGHGFDADNEKDRALLKSLATVNDMMLDAGMIKPTSMMAYFTKDDRGEKHFRARSARNSLRLPFQTAEWVRHYDL